MGPYRAELCQEKRKKKKRGIRQRRTGEASGRVDGPGEGREVVAAREKPGMEFGTGSGRAVLSPSGDGGACGGGRRRRGRRITRCEKPDERVDEGNPNGMEWIQANEHHSHAFVERRRTQAATMATATTV